MTRFEYILPGETTIKRRFDADVLQHDLFDLIVAGETVATVDYKLARRYWLGKITLPDLLDQQQKQAAEKV